jgi:2-iminobutanoate/2-iminopropanoate deaminase
MSIGAINSPVDFRKAWKTDGAPPPAGSYSQAISAGGMLYISGQTPRKPDGVRHNGEGFDVQARIALENVESIARSAGTNLASAAMVTVFLTDPKSQAVEFDKLYKDYLDDARPYPARAIVQSSLPNGDIEITAIIPIS